jgi:hypothetical protein
MTHWPLLTAACGRASISALILPGPDYASWSRSRAIHHGMCIGASIFGGYARY